MTTPKSLSIHRTEQQKRLSEIANIVAAGLQRYREKNSDKERIPLAFTPKQSVHGHPTLQENAQ